MLRVAVNEEDGMRARQLRRAAMAMLALTLAGCSSLHWPWHHAPPPPPPPVHELDIAGAPPDAYPQYWKRNTLLIDLSSASGTGTITLKPVSGTSWPVRLSFRVTPGAIGTLRVRGAERVVLPITPGSPHPIDLDLTPGVYSAQTPQITVSWGASVARDGAEN
jgi:hypothetical protein